MHPPSRTPSADVLQRLALSPVSVAEVSAERLLHDPPEIPWHITPPTGEIAMQLRTTVRRVAMGAGLARDAELVEAVRQLPGVPAVVTSPAGGTFIIGGEAWLGLCAIGSPPPGQPMPLDWMLHSLPLVRVGASAVLGWCRWSGASTARGVPGSATSGRTVESSPGSVSGSLASAS